MKASPKLSTATKKKVVDLRGRIAPQSTIIAVGAGKGGVGKSFFSSSLAYFLAQMGHKTLLVDMDLGAANLHTWLGEGLPSKGINEFMKDTNLTIGDVISPTMKNNLHLISGASEGLYNGDISDAEKSRLLSALYNYPTDYIILDLGAGTHTSTLDYFLMAQHHVVVFTPEPSSIENAYRFMKAVFYRKIRRYGSRLDIDQRIEHITKNNHNIKSPRDLLNTLHKEFPEISKDLKEVMNQLQFQIVLNQIRTAQDRNLGKGIKSVCQRHFGLPCEFLGALSYDNAVWQSLRQKKHLLVANPYSHLYAQIMAMARKLADPSQPKNMVS